MIQSNEDFYLRINNIIIDLIAAGQHTDAKQLEDALSLSTVPGEILGETRIVLENLDHTKLVDNLNVRSDIKLSLEYLNRIL